MSTYSELKRIAWECNQELPARGLVTHTFGNASAHDAQRGVFAIKPSGIPFSGLSPEQMVVVDLDSRVVEGDLIPSSDTKTHAVLYRHWSDVGGIVHTHSPYAVSWAQATRPIPVLGTTHADYLAQPIPCTAVMSDEMIEGDYEEQTGHQILQAFSAISHAEVQMVLVACHGPFAWGETPQQAVENSSIVEMIARIALHTLLINPETPPLKETLLRKHFERKHGPDAYYGQRKN